MSTEHRGMKSITDIIIVSFFLIMLNLLSTTHCALDEYRIAHYVVARRAIKSLFQKGSLLAFAQHGKGRAAPRGCEALRISTISILKFIVEDLMNDQIDDSRNSVDSNTVECWVVVWSNRFAGRSSTHPCRYRRARGTWSCR
jgi:hypothetical protein